MSESRITQMKQIAKTPSGRNVYQNGSTYERNIAMTIKTTTTNRILLSLCAVLIIGITGCGDDSDTDKPVKPTTPEPVIEIPTDFIGTWSLETIDGQSLVQDFLEDDGFPEDENRFKDEPKVTITTNVWTFNENGTWASDVELVVENEAQDIRVTKSQQVLGTYTVTASNYKMNAKQIKGKIIRVINGQKIEADEADFFETDSGTWSRVGNTLTLKSSDEDTVIVFKKR